ncbi:MAG: nucleotidyltransferase domain-containing protein [Chloroflexi bacterium]|nr:MAG: nucleotidyltransferase domain-containing protein [Chloroflexota bacterium]
MDKTEQRYRQLIKNLDHILSVLVAEYQPEKIILFGSLADDRIEEWSDIDLVIIKQTSLPFLQRLKEVALLCRASVGVDYLVYTPDEFEQMLNQKNPFILDEVVRKGKVLYDRHTAPTVV